MCLTGRLPERYQEFLKQNYKAMPVLFQWMPQSPEFKSEKLGEGNPRTIDFPLPQQNAAQKLFEAG